MTKFFRAFRDRYLAACFLLIGFFIAASSNAQVDTTKVRQKINAYGYDYKNVSVDSSFGIPRDTFKLKYNQDTNFLAIKGRTIYNWNGSYWVPFAKKLNDTTVIIGADTVKVGGTGGGGGSTNLTMTRNGTTVTITPSSGTAAVIPAATTTDAGIMTAAMKSTVDSSFTHMTVAGDSITCFYRSGTLIRCDTVFSTALQLPLYAVDQYTIGVKNDSAAWNADKIQGRAVAATAPTDGQAIVWDNALSTWKPGTVSGGGGSPAGSTTELQYKNGASLGAVGTSSYDATNGTLSLTRQSGDSALLKFDGNYTGVKSVLTIRPPVKNDSTTEFNLWSILNPNGDGTRSNHIMALGSNYTGKKAGVPRMWDAWESNWYSGGARYLERHYEMQHPFNNENVRLFSSTMISRDSLGNSTNQWDFRGNVFSIYDLKNNAYFSVGKNGNYTGVNAATELIGHQPYHKLTDESAPSTNWTLMQQVGVDLQFNVERNITFASRQTFKNIYFLGLQLYGDASQFTSSANWGASGLLFVNPTHASTGVARFQHTGTDALWILNNRRILVNSSTDNGIGQMQINGKLTVATVDSTSVPTNGSFLFADPTTGEIKRAVPPGGGGGITGSLTSGRIPKATGTTTLGDGLIRDNGTGIGIGGASVANNMLDVQGGNSRFDLYDAGAKYGELTVETPAGTSNLHVRLRRTASSGLAKWFFSVDASNTDRYWLSMDNGSGEMAHEFSGGGWYPSWKFGGTEKMRLNSNGELQIGSTTDQGAFTLQNTGGLFQNGTLSLRGTNASSSPYSILMKQPDSSVSEIALPGGTINFLRADGSFAVPSTGLPSQSGNADKFLKTDGTTASWAHSVFPWDYATRDSASTTNAVATTLHTITLNAASRGIIEVRMVAFDNGTEKGLTGIKRVRYKKTVGGVLTLGTVETEMAIEYDGGLTTATFSIVGSGNNAVVQVTGESAQNLTWKATILVTNYTAPL